MSIRKRRGPELDESRTSQSSPEVDERALDEVHPVAVSGWSRVLRGNSALLVVAAASITCLTVGFGAGAVFAPPGAADAATDGGPITVPVESKVLSNEVTIRGEAAFDDAIEVKIAPGELEGPAVVTGAVPKAGATLKAVDVALEVAGRPVIILPGALPAYRTLRAGHSGPDVVQLKAALDSVGLDAGDSDTYDSLTATAVAALYEKAGYPPPSAGADTEVSLESAEEAVALAEQSLAAAEHELAAASKGANSVARVEFENAIREAERELAAARAADDKDAIARAEDALHLARTQRDVGLAAPDITAQAQAVEAARQDLDTAIASREKAKSNALTPLPSNEVLYLPTLPRRVDEVRTERGQILEDSAMVVSGATLSITATAGKTDAELLKKGATASVEMPSGKEIGATIASIKPREPGSDETEEAGPRWDVVLSLNSLTPEQVDELRGQSVRIEIPVEATDGEVLAVPSAALSAGPGGETRIEIESSDRKTRIVPVETGLAADGLVEITGKVQAGDLVVVGR